MKTEKLLLPSSSVSVSYSEEASTRSCWTGFGGSFTAGLGDDLYRDVFMFTPVIGSGDLVGPALGADSLAGLELGILGLNQTERI